jgi:hypothetical protein
MVYRGMAAGYMKAKLKKSLFVPALCVAAFAGAVIFFRYMTYNSGQPPDIDGRKAAGTVNGEPFFQEDLDVYALELRAAVAADYGRRYGLTGMGAKFWDTKYGGGTPRQTLNRRALDRLARNMVLIQEARNRGIDAPARYGDLEAERNEWNSGGDEIVYGPKELGPAEYNSYRISGITGALKTALLANELAPAESRLRGIFAGLPDEAKKAPWRASGAVFRLEGDAGPVKDGLERALWRGLSPEEAARAFPGMSTERFEMYSGSISREDPYQRSLAGLLENAAVGECISLENEIYYVVQKEGGGLLRFEEAPGLAVSQWINSQFELFLDNRVKAAKITVYPVTPP